MAQAASVVVNDRATTPVAHTFAPRRVENGLASFVEAAAVPIGEKTLTVRWRKSGSRYYQRVTLSVPALVMETVNGVSVPTVPRVAFLDLTCRFDDTSTEQERKDAIGMLYNALAASQTVIDGTLVKLEGVW
ncbi:TPA_asm: coat protein [ssRNA phage SRR5467090_2]|uniref:Coat protein n=1 Tax=ssRNA phage SRR5467090_2 TaxID=2786451 RepID=A0A8S5KZS5_9VIRU|nr:coat protein [ssRNA phage SRR5467090_2]DAD50889.1 TPA_asm: coat protein [ssRNA phage SRR5467090_2]